MPSGDVDVDCGHCGCWFTSMAAYNRHRPNGKCLKPPDVGLVVSPRIKLMWSVPVQIPISFDSFGNPTEFIEVDSEIAGQWDQTRWRDRP